MIPRISVIVPNFNHEAFLEKRLQSIVQQTRGDYEVILLDDRSHDGSLRILESYARQLQCPLLLNEVNSGNPYQQWNKGVAAARGEFIWIAESDDFAERDFLEKMAARLEQFPQSGLAYCQSWVVDENERLLGLNDSWTRDLDAARWQKDFYANGRDEIRNYLVFKNTIPNASAVLFKKSIFNEIGRADETFSYAGDWHTWVRMLQISDLCFCSAALNYHRTHPATLRKKALKGTRQVAEVYRILGWMLNHADIPAATAEKARDRIMERWLSALTAKPGNLSPLRNYSVYRWARAVDDKLASRFARTSLARAASRIRHGLAVK